jgi:hypothetical protein
MRDRKVSNSVMIYSSVPGNLPQFPVKRHDSTGVSSKQILLTIYNTGLLQKMKKVIHIIGL